MITKPSPGAQIPSHPPARAPCAAPVTFMFRLRKAPGANVSFRACCPNWSGGKRQGWRAHHGRHRALGSESAWRAASAQEKLFLPGSTLEVDSHTLAFPKASLQGPRRCSS